jgi:integrase
MIALGWSRANINKQVGRIKRMFKWAAENELLPAELYHRVSVVAGLQRGRTAARETDSVRPVPESVVQTTMKYMTSTVAAMTQFQWLTGARPGEVCEVRGCDLDMSSRIWLYEPELHKTAHHGRQRLIYVGPRAQEVLRPFLRRDLQAYLFSPAESEAERRAAMHQARRTPASCGNTVGSNRKARPAKRPGIKYCTTSYARAIRYACDRAFPPPEGLDHDERKEWRRQHCWSPNQIRHAFATTIRREYGLESAQVLLGHALANVTQIYAEVDRSKGLELAAKIG